MVVGFDAVLPIMALDVVWLSNRCIVRSYTLYVQLKVGAVLELPLSAIDVRTVRIESV